MWSVECRVTQALLISLRSALHTLHSAQTMNENTTSKRPGVCVPFEEAKAEWPEINTDEELVRRIWEENDAEAYMFLWQCVVSF